MEGRSLDEAPTCPRLWSCSGRRRPSCFSGAALTAAGLEPEGRVPRGGGQARLALPPVGPLLRIPCTRPAQRRSQGMGNGTWHPGRAPEGQLGTGWPCGHSPQRENPTTHPAHTLHTHHCIHHTHTHHVRPHPMQKHTRTPHTQPDLSRVSCPLCPQVEALEMEPRPQIRGSSQGTPTCLLSAYQ